MSSVTNDSMKVQCFLGEKKLCTLTWDDMPNTGMSFDYENREYVIIEINDSKITVKDITKTDKKK